MMSIPLEGFLDGTASRHNQRSVPHRVVLAVRPTNRMASCGKPTRFGNGAGLPLPVILATG